MSKHETNALKDAHRVVDAAIRAEVRGDEHEHVARMAGIAQAAATLAVADQLAYLSLQLDRVTEGGIPAIRVVAEVTQA